ncbi:hypothetical protein BDV96DRAFT_273190 [Lophiotrema nucula]|uniref:Uncharacterized protein n=1 Tax=Lophiotrema nucula TaxID=690887 RepID=A0A6A5ZMU7_9PLEO|nr:hypothetical protein BDV96DRAFT_273190 [Lophiotrema nucula]
MEFRSSSGGCAQGHCIGIISNSWALLNVTFYFRFIFKLGFVDLTDWLLGCVGNFLSICMLDLNVLRGDGRFSVCVCRASDCARQICKFVHITYTLIRVSKRALKAVIAFLLLFRSFGREMYS